MKKVLFATTALIATASVAAADVSFGGYGRFGATYTSVGNSTTMTSRFRLNINGSTEADNGLSFGARIRIQDSATAAGVFNGAVFTVKSGGLSVSVGNAFGAIDGMPNLYANEIGLTGLGYHDVVANSAVNGFWGFDGYSSGGNGRDRSHRRPPATGERRPRCLGREALGPASVCAHRPQGAGHDGADSGRLCHGCSWVRVPG